MPKDKRSPANKKKRSENPDTFSCRFITDNWYPLSINKLPAKQKGISKNTVIKRIVNKTGSKNVTSEEFKNNTLGPKIDFLNPIPVGQKLQKRP